MFSPQQVQNVDRPENSAAQEEACIKRMMRNRDMADLDVTSPGVWEHESDAAIRELIECEDENEQGGTRSMPQNSPRLVTVFVLQTERQRAAGRQNRMFWLTMVSCP